MAKRNDRSSPPRRRTQVERSSVTRAKLLGATVRSLIEVGYARTTTIDVSKRAGLSRGAQLHHFPSKADLLIAVVEYLADERTRRVVKDLRTRPERGPVSLATVFDLLWTTFTGPLFWAGLELLIAARTDAELRAKLPALEKRLTGRVYEAIEQLTGTQGGAAKDAMELSLYLMRGMALERIISEDNTRMRELLGLWRKCVESMLSAPASKSGGKRRASGRVTG